jgi:hypothetical protein
MTTHGFGPESEIREAVHYDGGLTRLTLRDGSITFHGDHTFEISNRRINDRDEQRWECPDEIQVRLHFGDGFAEYEGDLVGAERMKGKRRMKSGATGTWTAKRLPSGTHASDRESHVDTRPAPRGATAPQTPKATGGSRPKPTHAGDGDPSWQFITGMEHYKKGELEEAKVWFEKSAEQGFGPAKNFLRHLE